MTAVNRQKIAFHTVVGLKNVIEFTVYTAVKLVVSTNIANITLVKVRKIWKLLLCFAVDPGHTLHKSQVRCSAPNTTRWRIRISTF